MSGHVALVTGASRGIGRAIAAGLSGDGFAVGLLGRDAAALAESASGCPGKTVTVLADVTDRVAVAAAVAEVEGALGPIDLLVNNAGLVDAAEVPAWEADPDQWWSVVEANLRGPYLMIHAVVPGMISRGRGRVLNINSGMGHRPYADYSAYSVSKGALGRLTDCMVPALEGTGVTILDVSPGLVRTEMTAPMPMWADAKPEQWNPVSNVVNVVRAFGRGELDELSGRFVHASRDDTATLLAHAEEIRANDGRMLRLRGGWPGDPLG